MQLREPKRKKFTPLTSKTAANTKTQLQGTFNGFCVVVEATQEAKDFLIASGCGKPNLSRSYKCLNRGTEIIRKRQLERRKIFCDKNNKVEKVIVIPDSDSETEDYFKNEIKPVYQLDTSGLNEKIHLELAEAYFFQNHTSCLTIQKNGFALNAEQCWDEFRTNDRYFTQNYICYHHFRRKNWIVKPSLKFGGDYLLYKDGPMYYHASYVVIIDILDEESMERRQDLCRRSMNTREIAGLNRLCESTGKELLIFQVWWPQNLEKVTKDDVDKFKVKEILTRRWDPNSRQLN